MHKTLFSGSTEPAAEPPPPKGAQAAPHPLPKHTTCTQVSCSPAPLAFPGSAPHEQPPPRLNYRDASRAVSPTELSLRRHLLGTQTPGCRLEGPPPACPHQGALPSSWGPDYALVMSGSEWPEKVAVPGPHACPTDLRAASASSWGSVRIIQGPAGHEL